MSTLLLSSRPVALLALLQLQAWTSHARLVRRGGGGGGGGDSDSDSDSDSGSDSESCQNGVCVKKSCQHGVCTTVTSTQGGAAPTNGPSGTAGGTQTQVAVGGTQTPGPNTSSRPNNHQQSSRTLTSSHSANPSQPSGASALSDHSNGLSKGGIAGIILAVVFIAGLLFMCLTAYRNRRRRALKKPQGFVPAAFLTGSGITRSPTSPNNNEMSQVEFGNRSPVTAAARTNRNLSRRADNDYDNISPQLSPLLPAITPGYEGRGRSLSPIGAHNQRNLHRSLSRGENGSILTSPYSEHENAALYANTPLPPLPHEMHRRGEGSSVAGTLHADMRAYQKALEVNHAKETGASVSSRELSRDPPPSYFSPH